MPTDRSENKFQRRKFVVDFIIKKILLFQIDISVRVSFRFIKFCKLFFSCQFSNVQTFSNYFNVPKLGEKTQFITHSWHIDCYIALIQTTLMLLRLCLNHIEENMLIRCACLWYSLTLLKHFCIYMMSDE